MSAQQPLHRILLHAAALFENAVVDAALDFKKHRRVRAVVVEAQAQFEAVLVAVDRGPEGVEVGGIEIQAVDGVAEVGFAHAVFIEVAVCGNDGAERRGLFLIEHVFLLKPLALHSVA